MHSEFHFVCAWATLCSGDLGAVEDLLNEGVDVNARGAQNRTPLQRAAGANQVDICQLLLAKGADPNLADEAGRTALCVAICVHLEMYLF